MSSIRSLATITLLAGVGIFLYLKINETPPVIPEEVGEFSLDAIEFGDPAASFGEQPSELSATPPFDATAPSDSAPAFNPSVASTPPTEQAPAWNGSQANDSTTNLSPPPATTPVTEAPAFGEAPSADNSVASVPDLPPLPEVPSTSEEQMPAVAPSVEVAPPVATTPPEQPVASIETPQNITAPPGAIETPIQTPPAIATTPEPPITPTPTTASQAQSSLYSATRLAVESALDRGELSQALLLLSDWYDDPSLSATELKEVNELLGQLAGTVIYSTEHRLEPPYMVQAGEQLEDIAQKYQVPWQLLAKINGLTPADQLQPGQKLKVVRGPFSALIDLGRSKLTLMLDRRYAGQFSLEVNPTNTVEEGHWAVNQKLLTPGNAGAFNASAGAPTEERSLMLSSPDGSADKLVVIRGSGANAPASADPSGRVLSLDPQELGDVYDILSLGSRVVIRR